MWQVDWSMPVNATTKPRPCKLCKPKPCRPFWWKPNNNLPCMSPVCMDACPLSNTYCLPFNHSNKDNQKTMLMLNNNNNSSNNNNSIGWNCPMPMVIRPCTVPVCPIVWLSCNTWYKRDVPRSEFGTIKDKRRTMWRRNRLSDNTCCPSNCNKKQPKPWPMEDRD